MLSHEEWTHWTLSGIIVLPVVMFLFACICCKKSLPKNDLLGLTGRVKITNPEEGSNPNEQSDDSHTVIVSEAPNTNSNCANSNKRTPATANRSLPDIPVTSKRPATPTTLWEADGDTSSELYATVEENKEASKPLVSLRSVSSRDNKQLDTRRDESKESDEHSSLSHTDDGFSPYACLPAEHPYDKLNKKYVEHPYAQVGTSLLPNNEYGTQDYSERNGSVWSDGSTSMPCPSTSISTSLSLRDGDTPSFIQSGSSSNPIPPPRTRKSSSHSSLNLESSSNTLSSPCNDIQAATAIAGRVSASQDLPYMTPPILMPGMVPDQQANFSGDSQDSKGYTSISVREPLANIKAQTREINQKGHLYSHYATVSDDSDEMYAAIDERGQPIYTSESETYAQIQPTAVIEPVPLQLEYSRNPHAPQPPSVDSLKQQVAQVHSRQASSSSATSSVANIGSPKPEKRQANSPLPPPPGGESPDFYASVMKKTTNMELSKNLDEMYAKVNKKKRSSGSDNMKENSTENTVESPKLQKADTTSHTSISSQDFEFPCLHSSPEADIDSISSSDDHNLSFESRVEFDLNILQDNFNTQNIIRAPLVTSEPGYESLGEPSSLSYNDPGYEVLHKLERVPSDCDPNYEQLKPHRNSLESKCNNDNMSVNCSQSSNCAVSSNIDTDSAKSVSVSVVSGGSDHSMHLKAFNPGYEQINSQNSPSTSSSKGGLSDIGQILDNNHRDQHDEPNYESMTSESQEPNYATVFGGTGSDLDPNYETVNHGEDPNYESVNYSNIDDDPPYEHINGESRDSDTGSGSGYEKVKNHSVSRLPNYERLNNDLQDSDDTYSSSGCDRDQIREHTLAMSDDPIGRQDTSDTQTSSSSNEPGYEEVGRKIYNNSVKE